MDALTVQDAARLCGMSRGQVSQAVFWKLVIPERVSNGKGDNVLLNERNVRELKLIRRLRESGLKSSTVKEIMNLLETSKNDWWKGEGNYVAVIKDKWFVTTNPFSPANKKLLAEEGVMLLVSLG